WEGSREFFSKETFSKTGDYSPFESYKKIFEKSSLDSNGDFLNRALFFDMKTFLHGLLTIEDKINMSYSLEMRVPLLGRDLVDFALAIPSKYKVDGGLGKAVFRKAVKGLLPDNLAMQRKQGFSPPEGSWYRGETMDYIRKILLTGRARKRGFFNYSYIERIIREHLSGKVNNRLIIWSLLCFEWWNRIFLEGENVVNDG
ncbi:MAG: asparagine synthase C-terminal domain-containing protein, partial [Firmicutes bacterium]|nr:asparagine synthase C-terminal domain-containing protein [Bacillota bacterium]